MRPLSLKEELSKAPGGQLAELYITIRNLRDAHRRLEKQAQAKMDYIARFIHAKLQREQQESFRAGGHTVYTYTLRSAQVSDPEAFLDHIRETGEFELIERRASREGCDVYYQEHGEAPPGVTLVEIEKLGVRKGK